VAACGAGAAGRARAAHREFIGEQRAVAASGSYDAKLVTRYFVGLDTRLDEIKHEIEVLKAHCTAGDDEIRAAAKEHRRAVKDAQADVVGVRMYSKSLAVKLRRLQK
jgi:hypothetical protein